MGVAAACSQLPSLRAQDSSSYKAVIIGHTGHGNYGHDHDLIFNERANIQVVAIADPDNDGRSKAAERCHPQRQYSDYTEMIAKEKPNLVCVALRCTEEHHAMGRAALLAGAHLYMEKPFAPTCAEADDLLALAKERNRKIVVAHQMRLGPSTIHLRKAIGEGLIGDLLHMRAFGKQDSRAGGEDMIVLGSHLFDLMRCFAGDPLWCTARIMQGGHEITRADVHKATEEIGPIVGDDIEAQLAFPNGVTGTFTSRGAYRDTAGPWGLQLHGSKGALRILTSVYPRIYLFKAGAWNKPDVEESWGPVPGDPYYRPDEPLGLGDANRRVVDDWLEAIQTGRDPVCSGYNAMKAVEMISGVFRAGLKRERVTFPLTDRGHPLKPV
jgi:predicted dehydrogenase